MKLLYITDISQLDYVASAKHDLSRYLLVTGDLVVADSLNRRGLQYLDEWDFLTVESIQNNKNSASWLASTWWSELDLNIESRDLPYFKASNRDAYYFLEAAFNAYTVYDEILNLHEVEEIYGYFLEEDALIRFGPNPTHRSVRAVAQSILFFLAKARNIPVIKLEGPPQLSDAVLKRGYSSIFSRDLFTKRREKIRGGSKLVLVLADGLNFKEYEAIKGIVGESEDLDILTFGIADLDDLKFELTEHFERYFKDYHFKFQNYKGQYPWIFANPFLKYQFEALLKELAISERYASAFLQLLKLVKPSCLVLGHDLFTIERGLELAAKKYGIQTVSLVHDGLGATNCFDGIVGEADQVLVWSDLSYKSLQYYKIDPSRITKIGSLRYEKKYLEFKNGSATVDKSIAKKELGLPTDKTVILIITAAINTGFCMPMAEPKKHLQTINELITLVRRRSDLHFVIKAHISFDYYELYRQINKLEIENLTFLEAVNLDADLAASDLSLMVNYFTTAALESMLARVPVIYLNTAVYDSFEWEDILPAMILTRIASVSALENVIDKLVIKSSFVPWPESGTGNASFRQTGDLWT